MSNTVRSVWNAKAKALKNAVWNTTKRKCERPTQAAEEPAKRAPAKKKNHTSSTGHGMKIPEDKTSKWSVIGEGHIEGKVSNVRGSTKKRQLRVPAVPELHAKSSDVDVQPEEEFNMPSIDNEFFADKPKDASDFQLSGDEADAGTDADLEPIEDESDNCIVKSLSAETPIWADDSPSEEDRHGGLTSDEHCNSSKGNFVDYNAQANHVHDHDRTTGGPKLVRTDTGKIKLMDQNIDTCCVVQRAILEAKCPSHLKTDNSYCMALATLVKARVLLFRSKLKDDACAHITAYYCLGPDCVDAAKKNLLVNHVYHYTQHFNVYAVLFWKSSGSPSKFSEVYLFQVKFLEKLRQDVPGKFHRVMADTFEAICDVGSHNDVMAILNLAGMDNDSE
ncbi:uncharacterized protein EDB93DRAFT_1105887 [Suillus bovinus]|uniref:uncharacterized protein n=1 Tax=Suillus bovinus TaxID=48563 RepID=UPI001B8839C1|nr:uncharacterized protein EDB93DRAFT_1105887 [Suillus bovinus]KAG2140476.1 hypothetical protein EDB93DRAFT_1105887 [Suillus bovinus]